MTKDNSQDIEITQLFSDQPLEFDPADAEIEHLAFHDRFFQSSAHSRHPPIAPDAAALQTPVQ